MGKGSSNSSRSRDKDWTCAQAVLDSLSANIAVLDEQGGIRCVNQSWRRFGEDNGLQGDGVGGNYLAVCDNAVGPWSAEAPAAAAGIRAVLQGRTARFSLEYPCHSPQQKRWFEMRASRYVGPPPGRVVVAHENVTARKLAEQAAADAHAKLLMVRESDRRQLAHTLHEDIAQRLCALSTDMGNVLAGSKGLPAAQRRSLRRLVQQCDLLLHDVCLLGQRLYPQTLVPLGLAPSLRQLVDDQSDARSRIVLRIGHGLRDRRLDPAIEVVLYRLAEEGLHNAIRHSQAAHVEVSVSATRTHVTLTVKDDGIGFDVSRQASAGVAMMREHCQAAHGDFVIRSDGSGTRIRADIPLK